MAKPTMFAAALTGAIVGLAFGYTVHAVSRPLSFGFLWWLTDRSPADAVLWATFGAIAAVALTYVCKHK